jgi:DMSO reductase anchor subunit
VALIAGSLHLGQPLKAWRSFLGWRKSWFSREVIALGGFVGLITLAVITKWLPIATSFGVVFAALAALVGVITVACSAMIYVKTRRDFWDASRSFPKFFGTTLLLGAAVTMAVRSFTKPDGGVLVASAIALVVATLVKLGIERRIFAHLVDEEAVGQTPLNKTARLLANELNGFVRARIALGAIGGVVVPLIMLVQIESEVTLLAIVSSVLCVAGEFLERYLFFTAVVTQKMPGGVAS